MAKHAEQLRYAHEANSQAFHFLFIYSKDKEQFKKTTGGSRKWWTHRTIVRRAALSHSHLDKRKLTSESSLIFYLWNKRPDLG